MKDRLLAALLTALVFFAGLGSGVWCERHRPIPPPPGPFMGEFRGDYHGGPRRAGPSRAEPVNRAQLAAEIEQVRPQIEEFHRRLDLIFQQFDRDLDPVLSPDQRALHQGWIKWRSEEHLRAAPGGKAPLTDDQIIRLMQRPLDSFIYMVVISMSLDHYVREFKLDDGQREKVRDLLRVRREKFLELVDSTPPPSLLLSRLAPWAQRLGAERAPANKSPAELPATQAR